MDTPNLSQLSDMVSEDAAIRRRQTLQPTGGKGDKFFPPTYPSEIRNGPPEHVYERRRVDGDDVWCVLVDSVQSQANRLEECLLDAIHEDESLIIPHLVVDFRDTGLEGLTTITSLEAPHRVYDAIFRDSLLDGQPFMQSASGQRIAKAKGADAAALLETSPTALLFGAWHSTGEGGGVGAKFARCLTSEIVGINVPVEEIVNRRTGEVSFRTAGRRTSSRIDPLGVLRRVEVFKGDDGWSTTKAGAGGSAKPVRPSEINHGNITPSVEPLGVTCDYLEHSFVLSFAGLRRLRFGGAERDGAARTLLAALGLLALTEQDRRGYALRSRCDLVSAGRAELELVHPDGATEAVSVDRAAARDLYRQAFRNARDAGFDLPREALRLRPQPKLVEIVRKSQELALLGKGGEQDESGSDK